jgi:hypothetical protein
VTLLPPGLAWIELALTCIGRNFFGSHREEEGGKKNKAKKEGGDVVDSFAIELCAEAAAQLSLLTDERVDRDSELISMIDAIFTQWVADVGFVAEVASNGKMKSRESSARQQRKLSRQQARLEVESTVNRSKEGTRSSVDLTNKGITSITAQFKSMNLQNKSAAEIATKSRKDKKQMGHQEVLLSTAHSSKTEVKKKIGISKGIAVQHVTQVSKAKKAKGIGGGGKASKGMGQFDLTYDEDELYDDYDYADMDGFDDLQDMEQFLASTEDLVMEHAVASQGTAGGRQKVAGGQKSLTDGQQGKVEVRPKSERIKEQTVVMRDDKKVEIKSEKKIVKTVKAVTVSVAKCYACPQCRTKFSQWSLCLNHLSATGHCTGMKRNIKLFEVITK